MEELVVHGKNAVEEALKSGREIEKVYLQHGKFFTPEFLNLLKEKGIRFQWTKREQLEKLSGTRKNQGIVAILSPIRYAGEEELFNETFRKNSFFVVLDGVTEPQNVGTIARTVESFGGVGILLPSKGSSPINRVVVKASSGAIFHLKVTRSSNLKDSLERFISMGGSVYSVETGGEDIRKVSFEKPLSLILGSEGKGISEELLSISKRVLTIPTVGKTPSLNVSVSAAISIWEVFRSLD
ncbi:23S rRNA (guanosine2251-2'-O)-methyltransferase [Balnearium lithotrophicum]|uniref:23S rRNA (Guanosine2251-2'-O)-methyltransferase n=1 Tax=Balnearium lithotrophicum TaxID=223788 RepID=A0A521BNC3_9BACT|nr:23S rRNA (guanosine(2251)-2'-O)-methyltransferase RlmB [Balnearium lithotrophicum]SMO48615.1 23S rRNA (guanosine2251-2'-O)-methyltransferase [Balnearium lithotrophicum]